MGVEWRANHFALILFLRKADAMSDSLDTPSTGRRKIIIIHNGPYVVRGKIPLVRKTQVVSEFGEPLTWKKDGEVEIEAEEYHLCRCGQSGQKPFCDGTHRKNGFDGTECAKTTGLSELQFEFRGGTQLFVKKDPALCMNSGYCGMRDADIAQFIAASDDTKVRSLAIAMVERCPSGALTYTIDKGDRDIEPDLPQQIADTTEITSEGPIAGPLWVTGCIQIERSDGQPFDERNRVTLCNCGLSENRPLCDGSHRDCAQHLFGAKK
jgi:CDGSH-type Zn-finger protein